MGTLAFAGRAPMSRPSTRPARGEAWLGSTFLERSPEMPVDVLTCERCGYRLSVRGHLLAADGTAMTVEEYLSLLQLTGSGLVCEKCQRPDDEIAGHLST
jgi:hypothetical protein